jgi:hypothetical protein
MSHFLVYGACSAGDCIEYTLFPHHRSVPHYRVDLIGGETLFPSRRLCRIIRAWTSTPLGIDCWAWLIVIDELDPQPREELDMAYTVDDFKRESIDLLIDDLGPLTSEQTRRLLERMNIL